MNQPHEQSYVYYSQQFLLLHFAFYFNVNIHFRAFVYATIHSLNPSTEPKNRLKYHSLHSMLYILTSNLSNLQTYLIFNKILSKIKFENSPIQFFQAAQKVDRLGHILYSFHCFYLKRFVAWFQALVDLLQPEQSWNKQEIYRQQCKCENSLWSVVRVVRHSSLCIILFAFSENYACTIAHHIGRNSLADTVFGLRCPSRPKCSAVIVAEPPLIS